MTDTLPWANGPYSIKRHGVSITNCDSEPVQTPGCIQAHGALFVLADDFTVLQAAENSERIVGVPPQSLIGRHVSAIVGEVNADIVARFVRDEPIDDNPLYMFTLTQDNVALDATIHRSAGALVLELEATGRDLPTADFFSGVRAAVARMQSAKNLRDFCSIVTWETRLLTGFDRVMVYRFHDDGHGEVVAEARRSDLAPWLGLHYPAEDIPRPAREVFKRTWVRPVPNVAGDLAELVPLTHPTTGKALVMTHCALRGPSVMYTEYLQNMGVTAACTMALRQGENLWGLIACHHYSGIKPVPYEMRAASELIAQVASLQLHSADAREHTSYRLRIEQAHREVVAAAAKSDQVHASEELQSGIDAGGLAVMWRGAWSTHGQVPDEASLNALTEWLATRPEIAAGKAFATDSLSRVLASAKAYAAHASGLLAVSFGGSWILWFRPQVLQTITWAGDPNDKPMVTGPHGPRLTPRGSFELFSEQVSGRSMPWHEVEVQTAEQLRSLLVELVVSRADEIARINQKLARTNDALDAFAYVASHDLKEPLRGIHKYAYQLANDVVGEPKPKLESIMRLAVRMDSLLESLLRFSRVDRATLVCDSVPIGELVDEAIDMVSSRADDVRASVSVPRPLPSVPCDRVRVRDVFVNLLSNALKYNDKNTREITVGYIAPGDQEERPTSVGNATVFYVRDNGIGIAPSHLDEVFKMFRRLHGRDEFGGGTGAGLTIAKKVVERHGGAMWLTSEVGRGTSFYFTLSDGRGMS